MYRLSFALLIFASPAVAADVDYTRDIRPILSDKCYACHGPDSAKRKAKLRLDQREVAVKEAIKPGDPAGSPLVQRVSSHDADEQMPPPESKKLPLTAVQVELMKRWIQQGAKFDQHWAYVPPVRPEPPKAGAGWARNAIDEFIVAEHAKRGFTPAPEADHVTLIRRLSFDLIGLPPKVEDVDAFVKDKSPDAYEKLVARLLASEHFGERMAEYWLDLVRYADTGGYHSDNHRDVTLFRDYVINAFNRNKPFDQFTTEQLAGDLLPSPTTEQRIASGYNRLLQTTEEGGAQPKEYAAKYAADRVRNASVVWLGATMGCCECHDHKFDPFSTKDFYKFAAFFADIQEKPVGRQDQTLLPSPDQAAELKKLDAELAELKLIMSPELPAAQAKWEAEYQAAKEKPKLPKPVADALAIDVAKRTPQQKQVVAAHFRSTTPLLEPLRKQQVETQRKRDELVKQIPTTLVSMSGPPRTVHVLPRGNWLDETGEIVTPDVPAFFVSRLPPHDAKARYTRLDLAKWLTAPDNPVVARVFVNRLWKIAFGQGLVKSLDDFGSQGASPTHPQLLDWLATEFSRSGWDVKHVLTLIVSSATYRQSSACPKELRERDPANQWLARQNRFRLDAEMVRDDALAVAGLLSEQVGGPSAKPAQPAGYWSFLNFPVREWQKDSDSRQYRRGLYTYWCRSFLHPALLAFDAPTREECTVERPRSSTPLQALVLLNDPNFVEAARVLAEKALRAGQTDDERFAWLYHRALSRSPKPAEAKILAELLAKHRAEFAADKAAATKLIAVGDWPHPKDVDAAELAAWTSLCRVVLNLHETITRN
ncbi:MAG: PSD1 and planctomycete cytochrome C domain-containing protein [Gemmataceae bacterium]